MTERARSTVENKQMKTPVGQGRVGGVGGHQGDHQGGPRSELLPPSQGWGGRGLSGAQNLLPYLFILKVIPQKRMSVATCLLITIAGKGPERADPFSELGWFTCAFLLQFRSVQSLSCIRLFATP